MNVTGERAYRGLMSFSRSIFMYLPARRHSCIFSVEVLEWAGESTTAASRYQGKLPEWWPSTAATSPELRGRSSLCWRYSLASSTEWHEYWEDTYVNIPPHAPLPGQECRITSNRSSSEILPVEYAPETRVSATPRHSQPVKSHQTPRKPVRY